MKITNIHGISLPLAVWLLHDNYDYINDPNYISATSLLRPIKQIILAKKVLLEDKEMDVSERISASMGNALHDSLEKAWTNVEGRSNALRLLGYPSHVIDNLVVNPSDEYLVNNSNALPVWIEKRSFREVAGYRVGGKLDLVIDGTLFDFKSTSVFTYLKSRKDEDYQLQESIYRWLNPKLITNEVAYINFIFTDWQKFMIRTVPDYPTVKLAEIPIKLLSEAETEQFVVNKLNQIVQHWNDPEEKLPPCTDKDLWRGDPEYKYYSDPEKAKDPTARSSKNFGTDKAGADAHCAEKGKGVVKTIPGQVKACAYCPAYTACKQKDQYDV